MNKFMIGLLGGAAVLLTACGGAGEETSAPAAEAPPAVEEAVAVDPLVEIIEVRQGHLAELGRNMKAIGDSLRSGEPDADLIIAKADAIINLSQAMPTWFPTGSGPETGAETEALPAIWENPAEFSAAVERFQTAAIAFNEAALTRDMAAVGGALRGLGGSCGGCHDNFRVDDE